MSRRHYVNNAAVTTLSALVTSSATSVTVDDASTFPTSFPWTAAINAGNTTAEVVLVTAAAGNVLTVTRGYDSTAGQTHQSGESFAHVAVAKDYDEANSHVNATSAVHGLAGSVVGTTDTQTLSGKTLTAPTLTGTANADAATFSKLALAGGTLFAPTAYMVAASNADSISLTGTVANLVATGTVGKNVGGITYSTTDGTFTAPDAGLYVLLVGSHLSGLDKSAHVVVNVNVNGVSTLPSQSAVAYGHSEETGSATRAFPVPLSAGDTVGAQVSTTGTGSFTLQTDYLCLYRVA